MCDHWGVIHHQEFEIRTERRCEALDITDDVRKAVAAAGVVAGSALVFSPHTTCSILLVDGSRDLTSLEGEIEALAPADAYYVHDDLSVRTENLHDGEEPANAPAHIFHAFSGRPSERLPVVAGDLDLEPEQRVYFVELCSARPRRYSVHVLGDQ